MFSYYVYSKEKLPHEYHHPVSLPNSVINQSQIHLADPDNLAFGSIYNPQGKKEKILEKKYTKIMRNRAYHAISELPKPCLDRDE